jgi:hypothetical protein
MCVIITFSPGATINKDQLFNAVHNNWHGYGLIVKDNGNLTLIKDFNEEGTDPQVVWDLLVEHQDKERYLHLRHSTRGATDGSNVQPFEVFKTDTRQIFFMHNGTLSSFGSHNTGKSDTQDFCDKILIPALKRWFGDKGLGDYSGNADFYTLIMDKHWAGGSTGLFVANDIVTNRIGSGWYEYKHPDETSSGNVWASNSLYFHRIQRGPMFQKLEDIRKAAEEEKRKEALINGNVVPFQTDSHMDDTTRNMGIVKWSSSKLAKSAKIIRAMADIVKTWDFQDGNCLAKLRFLTWDELHEFVEGEDEYTMTAIFEEMIKAIYNETQENRELKLKLNRYQKRLEKLNIQFKDQIDESEFKG